MVNNQSSHESLKDHQLRNVFLHHLHDHFCNDDNHNHNSTNDNDYNNNKSISSSINKLRKTSSSFLTATVLKVMQTPIKMIIKQLKPQSTATVHGCIEPSQHVFVVFFFDGLQPDGENGCTIWGTIFSELAPRRKDAA